MVVWIKRLFLLMLVICIGVAIVIAFLPKPIKVDVEVVQSGPMEVSVRDDGRTRIRERYVISTPIAGRLRRINLNVGDAVTAGQTVVASMEPTSPTLLDPRAQAQAQARVKAAQGRLARAKSDLTRIRIELKQAVADLERQKDLNRRGAATTSKLDDAQLKVDTKSEDVKAAQLMEDIAKYELELEQAGLLHVSREQRSDEESSEKTTPAFEITSPITGRVLGVMQESSAVVSPGASLLEIGDPLDLEVVVDVLSSDAVRILPGQVAWFEQWGGTEPLRGVVRLVEPSGFTKISALGVEEQRVNVVLDFIGSLSERLSLGDGYRVEARVVIWEDEATLTVPTGAIFRSEESWAVFLEKNGVAHLQHVTVGETNDLRVEIRDGLKTGDQVILYPDDKIADGTLIELRE